MTQEERLMILQMVADKKITVAEGVELIKAVAPGQERAAADGAGPGPAPGATRTRNETSDASTGPVPGANPAQDESSDATAGAAGPNSGPQSRTYSYDSQYPGTGFASFIDDVIDRVASAFGDVWGARYEFPEQVLGEFADGEIPIRIATGNGKVTVQGWDRPGYQADIVVKARGNNEDDARQRARDAYTLQADANGFDLEARRHEFGDVIVHVNLLLPRHLAYRLETRTGNGHIEVNDVSVRDGQVTTGNGRLVCRGGQADTLRLQSGNGAVEVESDVAELEAGTGNGSLVVRPIGIRPQTLRLSTGNGSVKVDTSRLPADTGYRIEANTAMGGVDVGLPDLVFERDTRAMAHKHIIAQSENFGQAGTPIVIRARTGMGSVAIF